MLVSDQPEKGLIPLHSRSTGGCATMWTEDAWRQLSRMDMCRIQICLLQMFQAHKLFALRFQQDMTLLFWLANIQHISAWYILDMAWNLPLWIQAEKKLGLLRCHTDATGNEAQDSEPKDVFTKVFPRFMAISERLWGGAMSAWCGKKMKKEGELDFWGIKTWIITLDQQFIYSRIMNPVFSVWHLSWLQKMIGCEKWWDWPMTALGHLTEPRHLDLSLWWAAHRHCDRRHGDQQVNFTGLEEKRLEYVGMKYNERVFGLFLEVFVAELVWFFIQPLGSFWEDWGRSFRQQRGAESHQFLLWQNPEKNS